MLDRDGQHIGVAFGGIAPPSPLGAESLSLEEFNKGVDFTGFLDTQLFALQSASAIECVNLYIADALDAFGDDAEDFLFSRLKVSGDVVLGLILQLVA